MEAFSLLKYWRAGTNPKPTTTATILDSNALLQNDIKNDENDNSTKNDEENDDGPFFDLEFSLDEEEEEEEEEENKSTKSEEEEEEEDEREFDFTLSSGSSNDHRSTDDGDTALLSPSTDSFFTGNLIPVEIPIADQKPPIPVSSLLKSATKLRVFMLNGLKKSSNKSTANNYNNATEKTESNNAVEAVPAKKFFTVKFKVEEVPIVSLFTRDTSSRAAAASAAARQSSDAGDTANAREVVQRYLKKVKPLYVRVSRRHVAAPAPADGGETPAVVSEAPAVIGNGGKGLSFPAGLRVVCKHLGKSRSASAAAIEAAPPAPAGKRRDDSLIEQQDGIQSAILHCKRSFNAARDSEATLLSSKCLTRNSSDGIQRA